MSSAARGQPIEAGGDSAERLAPAVLEHVRANGEDLVELASALVGFDTTARAEPGEAAGEERPLQEMLAARLEGIGAGVELFEPDPRSFPSQEPQLPDGIHFRGRPQLVARLGGAGGGRSMLLNGHIDVVPVTPREAWSGDPFVARVDQGRLFGRGACDMKGGIASMVFAVETLAALGIELAGEVVVNTVTDEESSGAGALAAALHGVSADACIVPEPTGLAVWLACRGTCLGTITVEGRPGHVEIPQPPWQDGGGVNAIEKAMQVLARLEQLNHRWARRPDHRHPRLAAGSISPVRIAAGDWPVTIPASCEIDVDVTFPPALADERGWDGRVQREIEAELAEIAAGDPWLARHPPTVEWSMSTPPQEITSAEPVVGSLERAIRAVGHEFRPAGLDSWYDGATFTRIHGIPAVGFGPGAIEVAHGVDEFVPIDQLVDCSAAIAIALIDHCGVAG